MPDEQRPDEQLPTTPDRAPWLAVRTHVVDCDDPRTWSSDGPDARDIARLDRLRTARNIALAAGVGTALGWVALQLGWL